jgi:hypothetical protein
MFRELCGPEAYKNVVVLTTFWDEVPIDEGIEREAELESKFFAELVEGGAQFMRHDRTVESARTVLRHILPMPPTFIQIQKEMGIDALSLIETAVGSGRSKEIEKDLANYKKEIADLTAEMENLTVGITKKSNRAARKNLETALRNSLAEREREYAELKKGVILERGGGNQT